MVFRYTKQNHDLIAKEFLDRGVTFVCNLTRLGKYAAHDVLHIFRVQFLEHGGISGKIRKKNRGVLTLAIKGLYNLPGTNLL